MICEKLSLAMQHHKMDLASCRPKTVKGVEKPLGVWDYEGTYKKFRTAGAKRYITMDKDGKIQITVAGLPKENGGRYLVENYDMTSLWDQFTDGMLIPADATGKTTHTYIDEAEGGELTDYLGNTAKWSELSSINLSPQEYCMSISQDYHDYFMGLICTDGIG